MSDLYGVQPMVFGDGKTRQTQAVGSSSAGKVFETIASGMAAPIPGGTAALANRYPSQLLVDCDVDTHIAFGASTTPTATTNSAIVKAGERQIINLPRNTRYLATIRGGSTNGTLGYSYLDVDRETV